MKRFLIGLASVAIVAGVVYAGDLAQVEGNRQDRVIEELREGWNDLVAGTANSLTLTGTVTAATITATTINGSIGGKAAVVATNAATELMVQTFNVTMHAGTIWTQNLPVVYDNGVVPTVVAAYTEDPGDVRPLYVSASASNQVQVTVTADKNFNIVVVGTIP